MRRASRRDENELAIVEALRAIGATVCMIGLPVDLLVGYKGETILIEIKNKNNSYGKRGLNQNQIDFLNDWRGGLFFVVNSVDEAIKFLKEIP